MINILPIVDAYLTRRAKENDRDYSYFHASEWEKCHRKIAYEYYESKKYITVDQNAVKVDPQLQRIFDNGHYTHDRWKTYLEATGALMGVWQCTNTAHSESPIFDKAVKDSRTEDDFNKGIFGKNSKLGILKPTVCDCGWTDFKYNEVGFFDEETNWGGHVDGILDLSILDKLTSTEPNKYMIVQSSVFYPEDWGKNQVVVDFKTMNPFQFKKLSEPLPYHITQMQIYLYLSGLKYGKFIYEDKAVQSVKEYLVTRDDNFLAIKKAEAVDLKHIVTHTNENGKRVLPLRGFQDKSCEDCLRCKYRGNCWR